MIAVAAFGFRNRYLTFVTNFNPGRLVQRRSHQKGIDFAGAIMDLTLVQRDTCQDGQSSRYGEYFVPVQRLVR